MRREQRRRALPAGAVCEDCGDSDIDVLVNSGGHVLCMDCNAERQGRHSQEDHHIAGRANSDVTIPLTRNDHAVVTRMQEDWPDQTLSSPDDSPLLAAAASVRGWLNMMRLVIDRSVGWVPVCLEALDAWLRSTLGPDWGSQFRAHLRSEQPGMEGVR